MFFDFEVLPEEFLRAKLIISIFDANTVMRDVEIGRQSHDMTDNRIV